MRIELKEEMALLFQSAVLTCENVEITFIVIAMASGNV